MREFLSERNIPFIERNIRRDPQAKADLLALMGTLVVPVVVAGDRHIVGYDPEWLESIILTSVEGANGLPPRDCASPEQGAMAVRAQPDLAATIADLVARIQEELAYNAAKGDSPYRQGMHDGLRFAGDALVDILHEFGHKVELSETPQPVAHLDT